MASSEIIITPEGYQKIVDEVTYREGEKKREITEAIRVAKEHGDLSENAEYDAAKEEQAKNEARIVELKNILNNARVVEATSDASVSIGSTVTVLDVAADKSATYTIVGTTETDSLQGRISNESPVGRALMGARKGDEVEVHAPNGSCRVYRVENIRR
jgi:transcription elongation factor GreA